MEDLDNLITRRLGERQRKIDFVKANMARNNSALRRRRWIYGASAAAAVLVIVLVAIPFLRFGNTVPPELSGPQFENFRGGTTDSDIKQLIAAGDYVSALELTNIELEQSEDEMKYIDSDDDDDEREYMMALERAYYSEMLWCRAFLLQKLDKKRELKATLNRYLKQGTNQPHADEARAILKEM